LTQGPASDLMYGSTQYPGRVAQLVEQGIENPRVGGSIPSPATIDSTKKPTPSSGLFRFLHMQRECLAANVW
jgi:hypothetical protein